MAFPPWWKAAVLMLSLMMIGSRQARVRALRARAAICAGLSASFRLVDIGHRVQVVWYLY